MVVHHDLALAADAEMFALALRSVRHSDESDVRVIKSLGSFPIIGTVISSYSLGMFSFNLHPSSDIDMALGNSIGSEELVSAETIGSTSDLDRVLSTVRSSLVKLNATALIAVRRISRPSDLIPATLEILSDLAEGEGQHRECSKGNLTKHDENIREMKYRLEEVK